MAATAVLALLAPLAPLAAGSLAKKTDKARGSLDLAVEPQYPQCDPAATQPGSCRFGLTLQVKIHSKPACERKRVVELSRVDTVPSIQFDSLYTDKQGADSLELWLRSYHPQIGEIANEIGKTVGGTVVKYWAAAPPEIVKQGFRLTFCKKLKSQIEGVPAPMPPPPEFG
ncbi:MAG TPA: hypothetical protein VEK39_05305 [Solirubrobacterales bacterium]|nr:hypothetical protein [Solirubrobacterales bacterium]